jgi:beta-barrel assembly-enhancing protease
MRKRSTALVVVALVTLFSVQCGSTGGGGAKDFNLISIDEEWQLGQQLSQEVASQVRFNTDPAVNAYIQQIGNRLRERTPAPFNQLPWTFQVVQDDNINAFAIPGGHVYVNTGLIKAAENASELAGVMGHEMSHVTARHTTEQISREYGLSILAGLVLGQNPGQLQQIVTQIVAGGAIARFSREAEAEADKLGIQLMHDAGYDPRGMAAMFRVLLAHQQSEPSRVEQFFATHPTTEARIRDAETRAQQLGPGGMTDEPAFQDARRRVQ